MRICIISKFIPPASTDGIPRTRWEYAKQFTKMGHEVHLVTSGFAGNEKIVDGIYIHEIPTWDQQIFSKMFSGLKADAVTKDRLCYSYLVYRRIKKLHKVFSLDLIESPLWDIEGYITRLKLPQIPFVVRMETTNMLLREILGEELPVKELINELETQFMELASGIVFDSWSILKETERLYHFDFSKKPYSVIHHGIEVEENSGEKDLEQKIIAGPKFKILVAGRLEKRKGSDLLVEKIIPWILATGDSIEIHLVGKDSAEWDGFKTKHGISYHEYIRKHFKKQVNRQIFLYGYVPDEQLDDLYNQADAVLILSRYESFGLLYLEAMRKKKPVIALNTGAVPEIFSDGVNAILISPDHLEKIQPAIKELMNNLELRKKLVVSAWQKLVSDFSSVQMAKKCIHFYEEMIQHKSDRRIFQVMNCLTEKDGVSNTTVGYDSLFKEMGDDTSILCTWATEKVKPLTQQIESAQFKTSDFCIYHYWNFCEKAEFFNRLLAPRKIFFFHNITNPDFFTKDDEAYRSTSSGYAQLGMFDNFDLYVCHTEFSAAILRQAISKTIRTHIIPPVMEKEEVVSRKFNERLILQKNAFTILFVGSIAPHKKQTDIVRFFRYYTDNVNPEAKLVLVGGGSAKYTRQLEELIDKLNLKRQVTLTGKVPDEDLYAYYRNADIFLSMSEHEGFGVPLAEAMAFDIPVVAYRSTAVPDTIGENGCLFETKDFAKIASLIQSLENRTTRSTVLEKQNTQLQKFTRLSVYKGFEEMQELAYDGWKERLGAANETGVLYAEDIYAYSDERFEKRGITKLTNDHLLFLEAAHGESSVLINAGFTEAEFHFLVHKWSGKVQIIVDETYEEEFDLFSTERSVGVFRLSRNFGPGIHQLFIRPTGTNNELAEGKEVFLDKVILKKPLWAGSTGEADDDDELTGISLAAAKQEEEETEAVISLSDGDIHTDGFVNRHILRYMEEMPATHMAFQYTGNWVLRDKYYYFTDGKNTGQTIHVDAWFVKLDLNFLTHGWSGRVTIEVDGSYRESINLYQAGNLEKTFTLAKTFPYREHHVQITTTGKKDNLSRGFEIFFKGLNIYKRIELNIDDTSLRENYKVSIVINTLNRATHLQQLLNALEKQTYPFYEIIVVNGPSTDETATILKKFEDRIKIFQCSEANLSMSRNNGIMQAAGNYVAFIDDDALPCDVNWLENFVHFIALHEDKQIGAIGGPVKHRDTEHYEFKNGATSDYGFQIFRQEELNQHVLDGKRWVQGVPGGNNIVNKEALYDIGGFDERFIYYLDETDMCIRLARKKYFIANNPINFIRHFKAVSNNRKSTYNIRWDIIARSDTYYSMKNGHDILLVRLIKAFNNFHKKHFVIELHNAYKNHQISKEEFNRYRKMLRQGFWQGIRWGFKYRTEINYLTSRNANFKQFEKREKEILL